MEIKNYYDICETKGYVWNGNGKIVAAKVRAAQFDIAKDTYTYVGEFGGEESVVKTSDGRAISMWHTEEEAATRDRAKRISTRGYKIGNVAVPHGCENEHLCELYYVGDNGNITTAKEEDLIVILKFKTNDDGTESYTCNVHLRDREGDINFYYSEQLCRQSIDVEVIEADGSKHTRPSLKSQIELTDTQRAAYNALRDAYKACLDAKIKFIRYDEADEVFAFNGNVVSKVSGCYESGWTEVDGLLKPDPDYGFDFNVWNERGTLCVKLADNE